MTGIISGESIPFEGGQVPGETLAALAQYSRFVQRIRRRYADHLHWLPPGAPVLSNMQAAFDSLRGPFPKTGDALRVLRQLVMERLVVLDRGAVLATGTPGEVRANPKVIAAYLGEQHGGEES